MSDLFIVQNAYLIPLLPLLGAVIAGFFGSRWLKGNSHWPIWIGVGCSAILSLTLLYQMQDPSLVNSEGLLQHSQHFYWWITAGNFNVDVGYFFDPLTAVMLCVICGIGFFITVFAAGYMKGESGYFRFFAYLGLFIFAMTNLVMGSNFVMLYLGWEGVGLCSYLLIGYYYDRPSAVAAAKKAFLVNRVGDFGFGLGIMLIYKAFGTVHYYSDPATGVQGVLEMARAALANPGAHEAQIHALKYIPFLLMVGAFGKSAQFPLYVWLPDAMEGPTPVSALIHAATMVTAGVYMIARCSTLFASNQAALVTIAAVGAFTALFAATIALRQFDLKKVFAYSTISQLGYMFVGVGILAPVPAVFHLVTHAFFKALLFLSSGVVMHAMMGHLDMRKMSGIKRVLPITNWLMLIGCLALAGFPLMSGFFSKDEIIDAASNIHGPWGNLLWGVLLFTAFLTAYYTFRLYFQVFQGPLVLPDSPAEGHGHDDHSGQDVHAQVHAGHESAHPHTSESKAEAGASHEAVKTGDVHESGVDHAAADHHDAHGAHNHEPALMIVPLIVLAIGALAGGLLNAHTHSLEHFLGKSPSFSYGYEVARARFADSARGLPPEFAARFGQADEEKAATSGMLIPPAMLIGGAVSIAGILLAAFLHLKDRAKAEQLAQHLQPLTQLLEGKYWMDEIYDRAIVTPLRLLGVIFFGVDRYIVDGLVATVGSIPQLSGFTLKFSTQRGYLQGYAAAMLLGLAAILMFVFI